MADEQKPQLHQTMLGETTTAATDSPSELVIDGVTKTSTRLITGGRGPISPESRELRFINEIKEPKVKCMFCNQMLPKVYLAIQDHIDAYHKPNTRKNCN